MAMSKNKLRAWCFPALLCLAALAYSSVGLTKEEAKRVREIKPSREDVRSESAFCEGIKDKARERRYAIKAQELNDMKAAIEERMIALEMKRAEVEKWQKMRQAFVEKAETNLIEIYSKMRPDAAAGRLEMLSQVLAASILMKMPPRKASVILNEIKAEKAAEITQVIAASGGMETKP